MFDIANFFSFLAALAVWDFICHRQDFLRGFRSGWNRSRLPKGPKPEPLSVSLNMFRPPAPDEAFAPVARDVYEAMTRASL